MGSTEKVAYDQADLLLLSQLVGLEVVAAAGVEADVSFLPVVGSTLSSSRMKRGV